MLRLIFLFLLGSLIGMSVADQSQLIDKNFTTFKRVLNIFSKQRHSGVVDSVDICSYKDDVIEFDWSKMKGTKASTTIPDEGVQFTYNMTFCALSDDDACSGDKLGSLCRYDTNNPDSVITLMSFVGEPAPEIALIDSNNPKMGVEAIYTNGEMCPFGWNDTPYVTKVRFSCGPKLDFSMSADQCEHLVEILTPYMCDPEAGDALSGGSIFLIVIMALAVSYLIFGSIFMYVARGRRGVDVIPHKDFWTALPSLIVAGCTYCVGKVKTCFGSNTITTTVGEYEAA